MSSPRSDRNEGVLRNPEVEAQNSDDNSNNKSNEINNSSSNNISSSNINNNSSKMTEEEAATEHLASIGCSIESCANSDSSTATTNVSAGTEMMDANSDFLPASTTTTMTTTMTMMNLNASAGIGLMDGCAGGSNNSNNNNNEDGEKNNSKSERAAPTTAATTTEAIKAEAEGSEESDCETQLDATHPDPVVFVERLLKKKWVTDDMAKWTIFEDIEDELEHHRRRSAALWHFVKAFAVMQKEVKKLKKENRRLHEGGAQLQEAYLKAVNEAREAAGDVAYWKELANAAGISGSCPGSASKASAAGDLEDRFAGGPFSPSPAAYQAASVPSSARRRREGSLSGTEGPGGPMLSNTLSATASPAPPPAPLQTPTPTTASKNPPTDPRENFENPSTLDSNTNLGLATATEIATGTYVEAAVAVLSPRAAQLSSCASPRARPWDEPASAPAMAGEQESFSNLREALRAAAAAAARSASKAEGDEDMHSWSARAPIVERMAAAGLASASKEAIPPSPQRSTRGGNRSNSPSSAMSAALLRSAYSASRAGNRSHSPGNRNLLLTTNIGQNSCNNNNKNNEGNNDSNINSNNQNNANISVGSSHNESNQTEDDAAASIAGQPLPNGQVPLASQTPSEVTSASKSGNLTGGAPLRRALFASRSSPWTPGTHSLLTPTPTGTAAAVGTSPKIESTHDLLASLPTPARSPGRQQAGSLLSSRLSEAKGQQAPGSQVASAMATAGDASARAVSQPKKRGMLGLGKPLRPRGSVEVQDDQSPRRSAPVVSKITPTSTGLARGRTRTSALGLRS